MDAISRGISAYYVPALTLVSSAYTPDKPGKPRTEARHTAKVSIFSRDRPGLVAQYEPLVQQALNADPDITFDSLDGNAIVNSLQKAGFNLFFAPISLAIERRRLLLSLGLLLHQLMHRRG